MPDKKLLVITASNGENLKLAEKFLSIGRSLNLSCELLDLTESKNDGNQILESQLKKASTYEKEIIEDFKLYVENI